MALSLGELVAAARQADNQATVTDRIQNGHNQASGALGSILGSLYGFGGIKNGLTGIGGNIGAQGTQTGAQQIL